MALVRCPVHKIPYNEDNPRGCPRCAQEKEGGGRASLMRELARAQQAAKRAKEEPAPPVGAPRPPSGEAPPGPRNQATAPPIAVTIPPRPPATVEGPIQKAWRLASRRRILTIGVLFIAAFWVVLFLTSGPQFVEGRHPTPLAEADVRLLPINPNVPITVAFSALGTRAPRQNPDSPRLARYSYGSDLTVDAVNGIIYAITLRVTNRSWRGLRTGMPERTALGNLALLGAPQEPVAAVLSQPDTIRNYVAYRSLNDRPRRTLLTEVRPPNGCFDVLVSLQPQTIGILIHQGRRYAVVGRGSGALEWVVTQIRIISRSIQGPYASDTAC